MKKIFLLIYVIIISIIFYQILLGPNGLLEAIKIKNEKEKLIIYKNYLIKEKNILENRIEFYKKNPNYLVEFANKLGFFKNDYSKIIKVINEEKTNDDDFDNVIERTKKMENYWNEINKSSFSNKINLIKKIFQILFLVIFGTFIIIIIFFIKVEE